MIYILIRLRSSLWPEGFLLVEMVFWICFLLSIISISAQCCRKKATERKKKESMYSLPLPQIRDTLEDTEMEWSDPLGPTSKADAVKDSQLLELSATLVVLSEEAKRGGFNEQLFCLLSGNVISIVSFPPYVEQWELVINVVTCYKSPRLSHTHTMRESGSLCTCGEHELLRIMLA